MRIVVTRKTGPALTKSCWTLFSDLLKKYEIPHEVNKSERVIMVGTNEVWFVALDDPEKLKSIEGINYVWCEEATEITYEDYMQLGLRCRGENINGKNMLIFSFNPVMRPGAKYLKKITDNPPSNAALCHSTYKDNPFLDSEYVDQIEMLIRDDDVYGDIYGKGKWAVAKNIIYTNWDVWNGKWPSLEFFDIFGYGVDFGHTKPAAIVEIGIKGNETWERELVYQTGLTNPELIELASQLVVSKSFPMIADCAEPGRIAEFQRAGFSCWPCTKGRDSIKLGIDRIKRYQCHIHPSSTNMIMELETYKWRELPDGTILEIPLEFNDHAMDARRYFIGELATDDSFGDLEIVGNMLGRD